MTETEGLARELFRVYFPAHNDNLAYNPKWEDTSPFEHGRWLNLADAVATKIEAAREEAIDDTEVIFNLYVRPKLEAKAREEGEQAGMRKVRDFLNEDGHLLCNGQYRELLESHWQAFLKENGLEVTK